jgi:hypothetical protein
VDSKEIIATPAIQSKNRQNTTSGIFMTETIRVCKTELARKTRQIIHVVFSSISLPACPTLSIANM